MISNDYLGPYSFDGVHFFLCEPDHVTSSWAASSSTASGSTSSILTKEKSGQKIRSLVEKLPKISHKNQSKKFFIKKLKNVADFLTYVVHSRVVLLEMSEDLWKDLRIASNLLPQLLEGRVGHKSSELVEDIGVGSEPAGSSIVVVSSLLTSVVVVVVTSLVGWGCLGRWNLLILQVSRNTLQKSLKKGQKSSKTAKTENQKIHVLKEIWLFLTFRRYSIALSWLKKAALRAGITCSRVKPIPISC